MNSPFSLPELMSPINELLTVGAVMLLGLLGGKLARRFNVPKVTGYLVTGLILGPSVTNIIGKSVIGDVELVSDLALGMIMFAVGGVFEIHHFRRVEKKMLWLTLAESGGSFVLVTLGAWAVGIGWHGALLLGAVSIASSPAVSLLVLREYNAKGPLSDLLLSVVAANSVLCILVSTLILNVQVAPDLGSWVNGVAWTVYEAFGSLLVGAIIGWILSILEARVDDQAELLMLMIGGVLVATGTAITLRISPLLAAMAVGAMTANLSVMHRLAYVELRQTEQPLYIAFFVLSGAKLDIAAMKTLGLLGVVYLVARSGGKYLGNYLAAGRMGLKGPIQTHMGLALLPQAGVAIGLMRVISDRYPPLGETISAVLLASIIVYETLGPLVTRWAISEAGEIQEAGSDASLGDQVSPEGSSDQTAVPGS